MKKNNPKSPINLMSLKEQVYIYLREQIQKQKLKPGSVINMDATAQKLGISKTPLRDALIELQMEGFVTIAARKGIFVNSLTLEDIRDFYQVLGALESTALLIAFPNLTPEHSNKMRQLNKEMSQAIEKNDFNSFYEKNLEFHNTYIKMSGNQTLINVVNNLKRRLYDFPRQEKWIKEWETVSIGEHHKLIEWIEKGNAEAAARFIRSVHWSFPVQEKFIRQYYGFMGESYPKNIKISRAES